MSRTEAILSHATLFIFTISNRIILLGTSFPALSLENEYRWKKYIFRVNLTKTLLFKIIMHYFQELSLILHTWTGDCSVQSFAVFFLEREHCNRLDIYANKFLTLLWLAIRLVPFLWQFQKEVPNHDHCHH